MRRPGHPAQQVVAAASLVVSGVALVAGCGSGSINPAELTDAISQQVAKGPGASDSFHLPTAAAAEGVARAVSATAARGSGQAPPGYDDVLVGEGPESAVLLREEDPAIGQGTFVVRPRAVAPVVVEVPHPRADKATEQIGTAWFSRGRVRALLVAGAHRRAGHGLADVTHTPGTTFDRVSAALATRGTTIVQLHGFDQGAHHVAADVILSSASTSPTPQVLRIAEELTRRGIRVCVYGRDSCPLGALTNVQAPVAQRAGASFIHVEMSAPVRVDPARWGVVVDCLATVLTPEV